MVQVTKIPTMDQSLLGMKVLRYTKSWHQANWAQWGTQLCTKGFYPYSGQAHLVPTCTV